VTSTLIELSGVKKIYGKGESEVHALAGVDLSIERGDFVAVMGPSGSGKSTCMNVLGALDVPSSGHYRFLGVDVGGLSRDELALLRRHYFGFVFQGYNLLARTTALENVELPLVYRGVPGKRRHELARAALAEVGLSDRANHTPAELSGGQQQRVAIARAVVTNPELLLADEPTGNLDSARKAEIMRLLAELNERRGITILWVTHEPDLLAYARRVVRFRDGRIESDERHRGLP
jgi:putative ABC transport system ATP-binding protein